MTLYHTIKATLYQITTLILMTLPSHPMSPKCFFDKSQPSSPPTYRLDELFTDGAGRAKRLCLERHVLLGLGVKGWVLYQAVDKHPQLALDVEGFEVHPSPVLLLGSLQELGHQLVHNVGHVSTTLRTHRHTHTHKQTINSIHSL